MAVRPGDGNDVALGIGASSGQLELNCVQAAVVHAFLQSAGLLATARVPSTSTVHAVSKPNRPASGSWWSAR